ncbi:MAG: RNA 2',3'-cyclic phosphodiesterase [bacterium]
MRLFFALQPPLHVREALADLQAVSLAQNGRHTHFDDLHLTLQFLGNVDEPELSCLKQAVAGLSAGRFELEIDRLSYWSRPKIAWAGPSKIPAGLPELVTTLGEAIAPCGFDPAPEPFRPHLTLARKSARVETREIVPTHWKVEDFALLEAVPNQKPNRYREILKIKLENK